MRFKRVLPAVLAAVHRSGRILIGVRREGHHDIVPLIVAKQELEELLMALRLMARAPVAPRAPQRLVVLDRQRPVLVLVLNHDLQELRLARACGRCRWGRGR